MLERITWLNTIGSESIFSGTRKPLLSSLSTERMLAYGHCSTGRSTSYLLLTGRLIEDGGELLALVHDGPVSCSTRRKLFPRGSVLCNLFPVIR